MKAKTSGRLRRLDLRQVIELIPSFRAELEQLNFDQSGALINPLSHEVVPQLRLLDGQHRSAGARYEILIESSETNSPPQRLVLTTHADDEHHFALSVNDAAETWRVDADLQHGRLPAIDLDGTINLTQLIHNQGVPGCLAWLLGGTGGGHASIDFTTLERRGGRLLEAHGRANRFRGAAVATTKNSASEWNVTGRLKVSGRGLGRIVLLIFSGRLRRAIDSAIEDFWQDAELWPAEWAAQTRQLTAAVEQVDEYQEFIHRSLWDRTFDPGPTETSTSSH